MCFLLQLLWERYTCVNLFILSSLYSVVGYSVISVWSFCVTLFLCLRLCWLLVRCSALNWRTPVCVSECEAPLRSPLSSGCGDGAGCVATPGCKESLRAMWMASPTWWEPCYICGLARFFWCQNLPVPSGNAHVKVQMSKNENPFFPHPFPWHPVLLVIGCYYRSCHPFSPR